MKKSFILYTDFYDGIKFLNNEEKGEFIDMVFKYIRGEEFEEKYSTSSIIAFNFIKPTLDRDNEKWEKEINARSEAGKKGMAKRWGNKKITKHNSVINAITKITDNVNDNVNDNDNNSYKRLEFLKNLPLEEKNKISKDLGIDESKVSKKANELYEWCVINGKTKKNYYLFLRVCLRKDFVESKVKVQSESANYIKV